MSLSQILKANKCASHIQSSEMNVYTVDSGDNLYTANKAEPEDSCAETDVCRPQRTEVMLGSVRK